MTPVIRSGRCARLLAASRAAASTILLALSTAPEGQAAADSLSVRAHREALGDSVLVLPEVRVDRTRPLTGPRAGQPTGFVGDHDARARGGAVSSIAYALGQAASVRVLQYGGFGAFSTVTLRGAPASHTAILVDGEPVHSAARSVVSLGDLPATAIDRVEVYRGAAPLGFGTPAPAGAVNLITLPAREMVDVHLARGSFGTTEARARGAATRGPLALAVNGGWQESHGDYDYLDDYGTPFHGGDDTVRVRANNRFAARHAIAGLTWTAAPDLEVRLRGDLLSHRRGFPGVGTIVTRHASQRLDRSGIRLAIEREARGPRPGVQLESGLRRERSRFADPLGELSMGRFTSDRRFAGEDAKLAAGWGTAEDPLSVRVAADARVERAEPHPDDSRPSVGASRRDARGLAVTVHARPGTGRLQLHAGSRWDRVADELHVAPAAGAAVHRDVEHALRTPQLGARVRVASGLELRANWTDARRAPDFLELFGDGGSVLGNPALEDERSRTWDAGAAAELRGRGRVLATLEYSHFETRADRMILYRRSLASVKAFNVARARIGGDEVSATLAPLAGVAATAAWTHQRAIDDGTWAPWTGKRLPGRPDSRLYARVAGAWGAWTAFADVDAIGANYLDNSNRSRVPQRSLVGAGMSWAVTPVVRLAIEARNLGDERASDVAGYPLPGRAVFLACEARWEKGMNR